MSQAFKAVFGDKDYTVKLAMFNSEGDVIVLKKNAIRILEIDDNIFNPFHTGTLLLTNDFNILENGETPYVFLGNGSDMLFIDIQPDSSSERFLLSLRCVITEATEVVYDNSLCKKLTFVEYGQYALDSKYCNFMGVRNGAAGGSNADSALSTGDIIKNIINTAFDNTAKDLSLFDIDPQTKAPVFDAQGSNRVNVVPYNTLSYFLYLSYILQLHNHQGSPCILRHDRFTKKFKLLSLSRLFKDNEKLLAEKFKFADPRQDDTGEALQPAIKISPEPCSVHFGTDSEISEFYTEAPASKNCRDHFANESVTSFSRSCGTFTYNLLGLNKESFTDTFKSLFVEPFKQTFAGYDLEANFYIAPAQKDNWIDTTGDLPTDITEQQYLNLKLMSLLFMNYNYIFKTIGVTVRSSGTFVDVVKNKNADNNQNTRWDYNTLGRHFVTCVKHIFTQNTYTNQIETIKPYRIVDPSKPKSSPTSLTDAGNSALTPTAQQQGSAAQQSGATTQQGTPTVQSNQLNVDALPTSLKKLAPDFITAGEKYNIDPNFLAAIAMNETGNGTSKAFLQGNNAMGVSTASGPRYDFASPGESIDYMAKRLTDANGYYKNASTIGQIGNIYSPVGAKNDFFGTNSSWVPTVGKFYNRLTGKDPNSIVKS